MRDTIAEDKLAYVLNYLNQGGSMEVVLEEIEYRSGSSREYYGDLNGDEIPELLTIFYGSVVPGTFELIGCTNGEYDNLHTVDLGGMLVVDILMIEDMNLDGLPEVLLRLAPIMGTRVWRIYQILGWDGRSFRSLISQTEFDD